MDSHPLLYTYRRCPYAMRARMALLRAGVAFDAHEIVLRDKPEAMLAISPKGTVPVLLLANGSVIEESLDIMGWALTSAGDDDSWWRRAQSPENLALLAANDGAFKRHLDRYKYPERHADEAAPTTTPAERRELERMAAVGALLRPLEARLMVEPFLGGDTPCAADIGIFPFARQFAAVDPAWFDAQPLPAVQRGLQGWLASALFAACMPKIPTNAPQRFPALQAHVGA